MNAVLKVFLSMSFSGGLLILALFLGKRFWKSKISRQWQYYIWLAVILRLLLPFGPEINLLGKTYQAVDQAITQAAHPSQPPALHTSESAPADHPETDSEEKPPENMAAVRPLQEIGGVLIQQIWLIWLAAALGLLIRKITSYQSFIRYIHAGLTPVSDMEMLDQLSVIAEQAGIKKPVELCVNPLVSSPLLVGFFRPCVVLPSADIPEKDFRHILLHELTHCKRRDMFYKWLVQVTLCLHWFNPLVYLMGREITKACEFSCDEAVLTKLGQENAQDYGKTLLDAMAAVGKYKESLGAVTLSENKQLLKERLEAIMKFGKKSKASRFLTGALTVCVIWGAAFVGVYSAAAADLAANRPQAAVNKEPAQEEAGAQNKDYAAQAERYYKAGSLPLFQLAFSRLDGQAQSEWLDRIYANRQLAFFGAAVNQLEEDCDQIQRLAETVYEDGDVVYFSNLTMHMSEDTLEAWLDRALEDENWALQSVLFSALDWGEDFDGLKEKQEKEWAEAQAAEYGKAGVTFDGKKCYYRGDLVNIFLDVRANKSFYTLDMNPAGTVNIKIIRDAGDKITGVAYMTEAEVTALLDDMYDPEEEDIDGGETISIPVDIEKVKAGEYVWLGTYTLHEGDQVCYRVSADSGKQLDVGFAKPGQTRPGVRYNMVSNRETDGKLEIRTGAMMWKAPFKPGEYSLFIHAEGGSLSGVKGSVTVIRAPAGTAL